REESWLLEQGSNLQALWHLINSQARLPIPPSRTMIARADHASRRKVSRVGEPPRRRRKRNRRKAVEPALELLPISRVFQPLAAVSSFAASPPGEQRRRDSLASIFNLPVPRRRPTQSVVCWFRCRALPRSQSAVGVTS